MYKEKGKVSLTDLNVIQIKANVTEKVMYLLMVIHEYSVSFFSVNLLFNIVHGIFLLTCMQ